MLENYYQDQWGVIHQKEFSVISYDKEYINQGYVALGHTLNAMSYLRFGYLNGVISQPITTVLDVGYGTGHFLDVCQQQGIKTFGCDLFRDYLPSHAQFVADPTERPFDLITFFDSLEHFENLDFVSRLQARYLCVTVPWCHDGTDDEWFSSWKHRKPNEHLHHFDHHSLQAFLKSAGYRCLAFSNIEDVIRKGNGAKENILTACFEKTG